jgi:predicted DNA-binding transcriptional regulator YafY
MNRLERFYKIDQLLQDRKVVSRDDFLSLLEVSLATFKDAWCQVRNGLRGFLLTAFALLPPFTKKR